MVRNKILWDSSGLKRIHTLQMPSFTSGNVWIQFFCFCSVKRTWKLSQSHKYFTTECQNLKLVWSVILHYIQRNNMCRFVANTKTRRSIYGNGNKNLLVRKNIVVKSCSSMFSMSRLPCHSYLEVLSASLKICLEEVEPALCGEEKSIYQLYIYQRLYLCSSHPFSIYEK